jgi:UDP-3-O-[3-hydroxymyristoyl] glucosamine N-acyltransferase
MAHTLITKDIKYPGSYSSASMPLMTTSKWRKNAVRVSQLNDIALRVQQLEQKNNSD